MKKAYITPYVTTVTCLVEQSILTTSMPVGKEDGGSEQWSNRNNGESFDEWEE